MRVGRENSLPQKTEGICWLHYQLGRPPGDYLCMVAEQSHLALSIHELEAMHLVATSDRSPE